MKREEAYFLNINKTESPIERIFLEEIVKYLNPEVNLECQIAIRTLKGNYRVDFLATTASGRRIIFECDGEEFHRDRYFEDSDRDMDIFMMGLAQVTYRLAGSVVFHQIHEALLLIAGVEGELLSECGKVNLYALSDKTDDIWADKATDRMGTLAKRVHIWDDETLSLSKPVDVRILWRGHPAKEFEAIKPIQITQPLTTL